jgi:tetratricopeptide (TPR) repeat protein
LSSRAKISLIVAVLAVIAAGSVVGVTLATRQTPEQPKAIKGKPPLGTALPTPAKGEIQTAFRNWPKGSLVTMERLGREYPKDPVVQFYRGLALVWAGYLSDAETVLERAKSVGKDTQWEIQADTLLHPDYIAGYPPFQPLQANLLLEQGARLQAEGKQHSALAVYRKAARANPNDCEAQVAVGVASFDKDNLNKSFSQLGPLTQKFPKCQSVRYYLGILLAWTKQPNAVDQLRKTVALGPNTELGRSAAQFLSGGATGGTGSTTK